MILQLKLLLYLDKNNILNDMKISSEHFLEQLTEKNIFKFPPLRYYLQLDFMELFDSFYDIGEFLLKEPLSFQRICNDILFACLKSIYYDKSFNIKPNQVAVILRLKCIPQVISNMKNRTYTNIEPFRGTLVYISKTTNYVFHSVWSCPNECEDNEVVLQYIPKIPPKCYVCRSVLFENSGLRRCSDQVEVLFKTENDLLPKKLNIVDDLIKQLKLGSNYLIIAVVFKKTIVVWSLEEAIPLTIPITVSISKDIQELYIACKGKPWKFIYCLASTIGVRVCPLNCFMNVKINLLLSLVSIKAHMSTGSAIIHFLAAGLDSSYIGELMMEAAKLSNTYSYLGTSISSVTTTLIGVTGGVCVMPLPLQAYSQKQIHAVLSAIETGEIVQKEHKTNLRCAVWAQGMDFKKIVLYNIGSVFGNICRGDNGEYVDELAEFVLQQAIETPQTTAEEKQALKDVELYIELVAGWKISLENDTENILRNYFLAARKERPKAVTIGSFGALVTTCLTSARMCRRTVTNAEDAIFAIWLHVSGMPEPRFAPEEYLETPADMKILDKQMKNFVRWLEEFTGYSISTFVE